MYLELAQIWYCMMQLCGISVELVGSLGLGHENEKNKLKKNMFFQKKSIVVLRAFKSHFTVNRLHLIMRCVMNHLIPRMLRSELLIHQRYPVH